MRTMGKQSGRSSASSHKAVKRLTREVDSSRGLEMPVFSAKEGEDPVNGILGVLQGLVRVTETEVQLRDCIFYPSWKKGR